MRCWILSFAGGREEVKGDTGRTKEKRHIGGRRRCSVRLVMIARNGYVLGGGKNREPALTQTNEKVGLLLRVRGRRRLEGLDLIDAASCLVGALVGLRSHQGYKGDAPSRG